MFKGKRTKKNESSSSHGSEEIDMNDMNKNDRMRSRNTPTDDKMSSTGEFYEDVGRVYSRSGQSGSIGDVIDDTPKLQRGLKARHVSLFISIVLRIMLIT